MRSFPVKQLKDLLVGDGVVTEATFDAAAKDAARLKQNIVGLLVARGLLTWDYFYNLLSRVYGVPLANLGGVAIDEQAMRLIPEDIAHQKRAIVFAKGEDGRFYVAMEDPSDLQIIDFLKKYLSAEITPFLATDDDLNRGYQLYSQKSAEEFKNIIKENLAAAAKAGTVDPAEAAAALPIVSIVDNIISYAITSRASDIHLEIFDADFLVRYRVDGILHEIIRLPKEIQPAIIARVKILSNLKLDEHSKPQDGRFRQSVQGNVIDARVSVMPTLYGEKIAMRILPATSRPFSFEELGFFEDHVAILDENLKKTYGMMLVTGPTGSGKTTTLYAMISLLNKPEVNIVTVEDPIEFGISNVNQTQINPDAGITFAAGLRAIVRQDPNVIMVGEIRDRETAEIAVHSALTGSLVLSTLHTNNAPTAVPRLLDIGIQPFLAAAVLNLIVAQRLVRRICLDCIASYKPDEDIIQSVRRELDNLKIKDNFRPPKLLYKGEGCSSCNYLGYKGRIGIYELLTVSDAVRKLMVAPNFTLDALEELGRQEGMITMFQDGLRKAERGITTIEEVLRVIRE